MRYYKIQLEILESKPYKKFLEQIVHDWPGVSDNIAYHLSYLEYLYQVFDQPRLVDYPVHCGLRIKTLVAEIASCAEVLLYDAIINLSVSDEWGGKHSMSLDTKVGFAVLLTYAFEFGVIDKGLRGRLHKLFDLRNKIHLTHKRRDPYEFNVRLLKDSEKTLEDLFRHFLRQRRRKIVSRARQRVTEKDIVLPWKRVKIAYRGC